MFGNVRDIFFLSYTILCWQDCKSRVWQDWREKCFFWSWQGHMSSCRSSCWHMTNNMIYILQFLKLTPTQVLGNLYTLRGYILWLHGSFIINYWFENQRKKDYQPEKENIGRFGWGLGVSGRGVRKGREEGKGCNSI